MLSKESLFKNLSIILISCLGFILVYFITYNTPELFKGGALFFDFIYAITLAYIMSYLFYGLTIHLPYKRAQKAIIDDVIRNIAYLHFNCMEILRLLLSCQESKFSDLKEIKGLKTEEITDEKIDFDKNSVVIVRFGAEANILSCDLSKNQDTNNTLDQYFCLKCLFTALNISIDYLLENKNYIDEELRKLTVDIKSSGLQSIFSITTIAPLDNNAIFLQFINERINDVRKFNDIHKNLFSYIQKMSYSDRVHTILGESKIYYE